MLPTSSKSSGCLPRPGRPPSVPAASGSTGGGCRVAALVWGLLVLWCALLLCRLAGWIPGPWWLYLSPFLLVAGGLVALEVLSWLIAAYFVALGQWRGWQDRRRRRRDERFRREFLARMERGLVFRITDAGPREEIRRRWEQFPQS